MRGQQIRFQIPMILQCNLADNLSAMEQEQIHDDYYLTAGDSLTLLCID